MPVPAIDGRRPRKPLRLWPGVVAVLLQWLVRFVLPVVVPEASFVAVVGGIAGGAVVLVWWLFFSRAPWSERVGAVVLMALALAATYRVVHASIATGMMGMLLVIYAIPVLSLALVAWAAATRGFGTGARRLALAAAIVLACGVFTLVRTEGMTGDADSDFEWRWVKTPEERLLTEAGLDRKATMAPASPSPAPKSQPAPAPQEKEAATSSSEPRLPEEPEPAPEPVPSAARPVRAEWPGFRGPERDGVVRGVRIETDWSASPPRALWRRPVGPGWSSFAVQGDLIYTQEQLGDDELVSSYRLKTGELVWRHRDAARFWESNAGPGPRATPTLGNGRVYTLGATGILNALDARDGSRIWSRNAATDRGKKVPGWGVSSSPLLVGDLVVVAPAGALVAYDAETGKPRWFGPSEGWGYSSPHLATIGGVPQIVLLNGAGAIGVDPADGRLLWKHAWPGDGIVQPAVVDGDVLIGTGSGMGANPGIGVRRVAVVRGGAGWNVEERWTSNRLKPYYNDFVIHDGYAFGFDGSILACMDLENGDRKWKGGRYGHGQVMLLADQDLLLVLSEDGELALVRAAPDQFTEVARYKALEDKTWNHPVLVGDVLLVRNGEEMAALQLTPAR